MIKVNTEYGLEGAFKADLYDAHGNLVDSTNYFSNFITYSGLLYPLIYHFPECFSFLTLGNSSDPNTINTTGIGAPISLKVADAFENINYQNQSLSYLGPNYYSLDNCGSSVSKDGPTYFRSWKIPSGNNTVAGEATTIREFMVSPSSGNDKSGNVAFSRVRKEVTIKSGNSAILTYRLKLKILATGINYLTGFDISNADLEDGSLVTDWTGTTGIYRQVYNGLSAIDKNGNTFIPKYGDVMEPASRNQKKFAAYFSPDYGQFATNTKTGRQFSVSDSYKADGLFNVAFGYDYASQEGKGDPKEYKFKKETIESDIPGDDQNYAKNIRLNGDIIPNYNNFTGALVNVDFKTISFDYSKLPLATPGVIGFDPNLIDYRNKASMSAGVFTEKFDPRTGPGFLQKDRKKTLIRRILFTPNRSYGTNTRYSSFVYGFKNGEDIYPVIDCIFSNKSGQLLMPHFREFTGFHNFEPGSGIGTGRATLSPAINNFFNYNILVNSTGHITGFVKTGLYQSGIFDRYLQRHFPQLPAPLNNLPVFNSEPKFTGTALHPSGYPNFNNTDEIKLIYEDLQFFASGFGYVPTGYYEFSSSKQVLHEVSFSGDSNTNLLKTPLKLSKSRITGQNNSVSGGFFLSRIEFLESGINGEKEKNTDIVSLIGGLDNIETEQYFTGYLYSGDTLLTSFNVFGQDESLQLDESTTIDALRLNRLVNNSDATGSAIASLGKRGSGLLNIPNPDYNLKFSGGNQASSTGLALSGWSSVACSSDGETVVVAASDPNSYVYYNVFGGKPDSWEPFTGVSGSWVALTRSDDKDIFHGITTGNYFKITINEENFPIVCETTGVAYSKIGYTISGKTGITNRIYTVSNYGVINNSLFIKSGDTLEFKNPMIEDYSVINASISTGGSNYATGNKIYLNGGKKPDGSPYDTGDLHSFHIEVTSTGADGTVTDFDIIHRGSYYESFEGSWGGGDGTGFSGEVSFDKNSAPLKFNVVSADTGNKTFTFTGSGIANYHPTVQTSNLIFYVTGNSGSFIDIDADEKIYTIARAGNIENTRRNFIFKSENSGQSWDLKYVDDESDKFKKISCSKNGDIACATRSFDNLLISRDGGNGWENASCPFNWTSIDMSDDAKLIAAAARSDVINPGDLIYFSYDEGRSWFPGVKAGVRNWKEITVSSNGRRIMASPENGLIYKSFNSGKNWGESQFETGWAGLASSSNGRINFGVVSGGYVYAPLNDSEKLYIVYVNNTGNYTWEATSHITGTPVFTHFKEPSGVPTHREAAKLLPNNYFIDHTGQLLSIISGGPYPGLSDKNNLEVQVNMSWSASCAGVTDCTDPTD